MYNDIFSYSPLTGLGSLYGLFGGASEKTRSASSFGDIFAAISDDDVSLEDMWKASFERHFGQGMGRTYYHVMDASSISRGTWCHNDFPYGEFLRDEVDESVLTWQPSRMNPSQLDSDVQAKISATLGQHAIIVPPELEEKMKDDPALRQKVMENIDKIYAFHAPRPYMTMPGTKVYGTPIYGSVIILDNDGEVANCEVSSGGTMIGPDEETLREIERERKRKAQKKLENRLLEQEAVYARIDERHAMMREETFRTSTELTPQHSAPLLPGIPARVHVGASVGVPGVGMGGLPL